MKTLKPIIYFLSSVIASLIASILYSFVYQKILELSPNENTQITFIAFFIIILPLLLLLFILVNRIHFYEHILQKSYIEINSTINNDNIILSSQLNETNFEETCKKKCRFLLDSFTQTFKQKKALGKIPGIYSGIFIPDENNEYLSLFIQDSMSFFKESIQISNKNYFASYCYNYDEENKNTIKSIFIYDNILLKPKGFNKDIKIDGNNGQSLNIESAIGRCLKYQNKKIGVFIVASDKSNYFNEFDAKYFSIISNKITSILAHHREYCPWHKKGWRTNIPINKDRIISEAEFIFNFNKYTEPLSIHNYEMDIYIELIDNIKKYGIKAVFICGTFNGWNKGINQLEKAEHFDLNEKKENEIWKTIIHLPAGYYQYKYYIQLNNEKEVGITQNWIFDIHKPAKKDEKFNDYINSLEISK